MSNAEVTAYLVGARWEQETWEKYGEARDDPTDELSDLSDAEKAALVALGDDLFTSWAVRGATEAAAERGRNA